MMGYTSEDALMSPLTVTGVPYPIGRPPQTLPSILVELPSGTGKWTLVNFNTQLVSSLSGAVPRCRYCQLTHRIRYHIVPRGTGHPYTVGLVGGQNSRPPLRQWECRIACLRNWTRLGVATRGGLTRPGLPLTRGGTIGGREVNRFRT